MATATSNGLTAAQLAAQAGVTEAEIIAEQTKYPTLNPDALVGNIMSRKSLASRNVTPAVPVTNQGVPNPAPVVSSTYAPVAPADKVPTPTPAPAPTPEKSTPTSSTGSYSVVAGDNLTKIAQKFGTTVAAILAANPTIKNPNLILTGSQLVMPSGAGTTPFKLPTGYEQINGAQFGTSQLQTQNYSDIKTDPTGTFLYGKRRSIADTVNEQANSTYNLTETAKSTAGADTRYSSKEDEIIKKMEEEFGLTDSTTDTDSSVTTSDGSIIDLKGDQGALALYKELMQSPEIKKLGTAMANKQEELDKINAAEVAFANDILKEVQGEAPQSYIDALVAERSKDLYPKKMALTAELRNMQAQYTAEKENAANILQFTIHDADNRYNRMFQMLQFYAQKDQQKLSNELSLLNILKDLPTGRTVTINGKTYKGMSDTASMQVVQFTDQNGNITLAGIDKMTGKKKYTTVIGKTKVSGGAADSYVKQLAEENAKSDLEIRKGLSAGTYKEIADADGTIKTYRYSDYVKALDSWSTSKETGGTQWFRNDDSVTVGGKTYTGASDSMPNIVDYQIFTSK